MLSSPYSFSWYNLDCPVVLELTVLLPWLMAVGVVGICQHTQLMKSSLSASQVMLAAGCVDVYLFPGTLEVRQDNPKSRPAWD